MRFYKSKNTFVNEDRGIVFSTNTLNFFTTIDIYAKAEGKSHCDPQDQFNPTFGKGLAQRRAQKTANRIMASKIDKEIQKLENLRIELLLKADKLEDEIFEMIESTKVGND